MPEAESAPVPKVVMTNVAMDLGGGTDFVGLAAARALRQAGFDVTLRTVEPTDWAAVAHMFPGFPPIPESALWARKPPSARGGAWLSSRRIRSYRHLLGEVWRNRHGLLVVNLNGDVVPAPAHLTYVHYPAAAAVRHPDAGPFGDVRFGGLVARLVRFQNQRALRKVRPRMLANSSLTQAALAEAFGIRAEILFPPARLTTAPPEAPRADAVVTIASYRARKHLERVLGVAALVPEARWQVAGASGPAGAHIRRELEGEALRCRIQDRVTFLHDVPRETVERLYWTSRVYFHPTPEEHFGISVVEAMQAGCVPVVPRSGGPWVDILDSTDGRWGYGYDSLEEAAEVIRALFADGARWPELSRRAQERGRVFSEERFSRDLVRILKEVAADGPA